MRLAVFGDRHLKRLQPRTPLRAHPSPDAERLTTTHGYLMVHATIDEFSQSADMTLSINHSTANEIAASISAELLDYLQQQQELFEQSRSRLVEGYERKFVWFENGQVLDSDVDESTLFLRISAEFPERPLFIAQVLRAEPKRVVHSGFLGAR
ncbi:hypothetical protein ACQ4M3_26285 [Leptolyngbya sp. AN03gr2]|uniref:hypothetical protein n=1 Tax=unclassified Leptolyngbya TaxID=2650499 RepID=UPI003D31BAC7